MLQVTLDRQSSTPLHRQLTEALRDAVRSRRLPAGELLPSSRELAGELGLSRGVVVEAYRQLAAEGLIESRQGARGRVIWKAPASASAPASELDPTPTSWDFHPGMPDVSIFPWRPWLRALRAVPNAVLGYPDPRGSGPLRAALAQYLARSRAIDAGPDDILVFGGFTQAFAALCRTLRERGTTSIAVEDPGWPVHRVVASRLRLSVVSIPVDEEGIVVAELERHEVEAVVVCPAHHFPTGVVMSPQRRNELIDWAVGNRRLIIEDDYDAELRYDRPPVGVLQGLAPEQVVYGGSVSKILAPGLRLGWLVVPTSLLGELADTKTIDDLSPPAVEQFALAELLEQREIDRHLRRARRHYRERREAAVAALKSQAPHWSIEGTQAGLHLVAHIGPVDETQLVLDAREAGANLFGLSWQYAVLDRAPAGLVLGYGGQSADQFEAGIRRVIEVEQQLRR